MKLLLLDMDGTLRRCKSNPDGFINEPEDQELIPEAHFTLMQYRTNGWLCVGVSNQGGVAAGYKTLDDAIAEQRYTLKLANEHFSPEIRQVIDRRFLSRILFCPDNGESCYEVGTDYSFKYPDSVNFQTFADRIKGFNYRKPSPGMLRLARMSLSCTRDFEQTLMVGDRPEDEQAAQSADIPFMWVKDWWNS